MQEEPSREQTDVQPPQVSASTEGPKPGAPFLSQKEFRPTPYQQESWEIVGERAKEREFVSMSLEVFRDESAQLDPMFESFDVEPDKYRQGTRFETPGGAETAADISLEPAAGVPAIDEEALQALLAEKLEEGRLLGLEEGKKEAEEQLVESYEALNKRLEEFSRGIETEVHEHVTALERRALSFALDVARKIVETTAEAKPEYIFEVIRKGMQNLGAAEAVRIRVSPDDFEFLEVIGLPADLTEAELGLKYVADERVSSGCVIESNFGEISLELDAMWEQIKDSLFTVTS